MPALSIASPNQIAATSGRFPRLSLADAVRAQVPQLYADRAFEQEQRAVDLQAEAQQRQQAQQTTGSLIQGVGTLAQAGMVAKNLGLFGQGTAATAPAATTPTIAAPVAASSTAAGIEAAGVGVTGAEAAGLAGEGALFGATTAPGGTVAAGEAASASGGAAAGSGALASVAGGVGGAAIGTAAGRAHQDFAPRALEVAETFPVGFFLSEGTTQKLAGAKFGGVTGAATGFLTGGFPGAIIGGIGGALGGAGLCPIHSAAYGNNSEEVAIARAFRDRVLTREQLRGYYAVYEGVAVRMDEDPAYRATMTRGLIDPLIRYGRWHLGRTPHVSSDDMVTAQAFLKHIASVGAGLPSYTRKNGEVI